VEEGDQGILWRFTNSLTYLLTYLLGKESWKMKYGQQDTSTAGGRWRRQHKTELDGDKRSVDYVPPGATRRKSSKSITLEQTGTLF